jgi:hypothetical protein
MMRGMGHPRRSAVAVAVAVLAAGCSAGSPPDDGQSPSPESAALRVQTVSGADQLDERTRTELEGEVGDVLSAYVVAAFLDDFPRQEFVQAFESFTSGAARSAAGDIRWLTAHSVRDARAVRATDLDARLSFLTRAGEVHGGTARVHFAFEATMEDGTRRPLALDGRFMLDAERGTWSIFGYDVTLDDGDTVDGETDAESAP